MDSNPFASALSEGGILWAYAAAFGYGVLASLTPCVYPMIGITVSIFGARSVRRRIDGFLLSGAFVLGIAAMFSTLGLVAGLTGMVFGSLLAHAWVVIGIAALLVALSLSMFGVYEIRLPAAWQEKMSGVGGRGGHLGAFLMGLVAGVIAAPCTGPFLLGILTYIGTTGSPLLGFTFLFVFSMGLGLLFLILGTFAVSLPKSGPWMEGVKSFLGCILVATAMYFLLIPFPALGNLFIGGPLWYGVAAALILAGAFGGGLHHPLRGEGPLHAVRKIAGIAFVCAGMFGLVSSFLYSPPLHWLELRAAQAKAASERRPLLVDFTARWCTHCKEIERNILSDPDVREILAEFVIAKVDLSTDPDAAEGGAFTVAGRPIVLRGLPRILLFDADGTLVKDWGGDDPAPHEKGPMLDAFRRVRDARRNGPAGLRSSGAAQVMMVVQVQSKPIAWTVGLTSSNVE